MIILLRIYCSCETPNFIKGSGGTRSSIAILIPGTNFIFFPVFKINWRFIEKFQRMPREFPIAPFDSSDPPSLPPKIQTLSYFRTAKRVTARDKWNDGRNAEVLMCVVLALETYVPIIVTVPGTVKTIPLYYCHVSGKVHVTCMRILQRIRRVMCYGILVFSRMRIAHHGR